MMLVCTMILTLLLSILMTETDARTVLYDLIFERKLVAPDGFERSGITVNGGLIGPSIEAFVGDNVVVNVTNLASEHESFTIHWHGVSGLESAWHDGAQGITNCPIPHGTSVQHKFTALSEGTNFYHAHSGNLRVEGGYGLIVFRAIEPHYSVDGELSLILSDWYHASTLELTTGLKSNPFKWVHNGDSILLNGKGLSRECSNDTSPTVTYTNITYFDGSISSDERICQGKRERLVVEEGKTYLLRLVNAASLGYYNFAIANHPLTIVGAGSSPTIMTEVNSVELSSGQRLEVLITCNKHTLTQEDESQSFLMQIQSDYRGADESFAGVGYGYLSYVKDIGYQNISFDDTSDALPVHDYRHWDEWDPLLKQNMSSGSYKRPPQNAAKTLVFITQQEWVDSMTGRGYDPAISVPTPEDDSMSLAWTLNRQKLTIPDTPLLLKSYVDGSSVENPSIIRLNKGDVVDITIQNSVATNGVCESHPWHIHGDPAWIIGEGSGAFDPEVDPASYNLIDPPFLDTVTNFPSHHSGRRNGTLERGIWQTPCGWFTMRIEALLPGMWFFHCHVDWHIGMGMGLVIDVESETVAKYPRDIPLCGKSITQDTYREGNLDSSKEFSTMDVVGIALGCTVVTLLLSTASMLMYTRNDRRHKELTMQATASPFQNEEL